MFTPNFSSIAIENGTKLYLYTASSYTVVPSKELSITTSLCNENGRIRFYTNEPISDDVDCIYISNKKDYYYVENTFSIRSHLFNGYYNSLEFKGFNEKV